MQPKNHYPQIFLSFLHPIIQKTDFENSPSIVDTITQQQDIVPTRQNLVTNNEI
jgi:hypothetical protein